MCAYLLYWYRRFRAGDGTSEALFSYIYRHNAWGGSESASGPGSSLSQTAELIKKLPELFQNLGVKSILDLPCGDFFWMNQVNIGSIEYIGGDIVSELIDANKRKYNKAGITFVVLDLLKSQLPRVDFVLCRDCFAHMSYVDIFRSIDNICRSGSAIFLTTTYTQHTDNRDIHTGSWRAINLRLSPFNFPVPRLLIEEKCTESRFYSDKSLGLWTINDLKQCLLEFKHSVTNSNK
jgi:SAM-dependent methyltransferase